MWLNKHIKTQTCSGAELERSEKTVEICDFFSLKKRESMEQGQREADEESFRNRFICQKKFKKRNWTGMLPNYIINSIISINLSLTCEVSACTILSWTLGQIKIPRASHNAQNIRKKNSSHTYTRCSEDW